MVTFFEHEIGHILGFGHATSGGDPYSVPGVVDTNPDPNVVETTITAQESTVDVGNGITAHAETFNGAIPGPTFHLKVGDTVIVHFENHLDKPTGIHWHGVEVPNSIDGTPFEGGTGEDIAVAALRGPLPPNAFLACPAGYCSVAEAAPSPVFALSADALVPVPDAVPPERAVLAANMETALNAVWDSGASAADRIAVVGAGVVGALVAYLCGRERREHGAEFEEIANGSLRDIVLEIVLQIGPLRE